ncbi:NAD(P)/FAD-dependent oxidoreductase [Shouchella shacheensis]|uniref:NAD(P)/FAD-dependent oxidoreductase n=1 Tax=Shouchella shacheensis TaxID=1649580 RepID=UPI000740441E|nr:FAD-binding oxidoreductase [Shouchella shacheensis]
MKSYIVIGAGILGASAAYHLAKTGAHVTLIDREEPGQATRAGAGIICPWLTRRRNQIWYTLVKKGAAFYPQLLAELEALGETNTGYAKVGAIRLHDAEEELERVLEIAEERKADAPEMGVITKLSPQKTKALFPPLDPAYGSIHISGAARVKGQVLCESLIRAAKKLGAETVNADVKLIEEGQTIKGVRSEDQEWRVDKVILTGGAWAKSLLKPLHLQFYLRPQKAQIVHLDLPRAQTDAWPVVIPPGNQYLLAFGGGHIIAGATHENDAGFDSRVTAGGVNDVLGKLLKVAPGLAEATWIETRVGFRPVTPDSVPVMGMWPPYSGLVIANGLGASGLTAGPYFGSQLAKLALGVELELNLADYDLAKAIQVME